MSIPTPGTEGIVQSAPSIGLAGFQISPQDDVPGFNVRPADDVLSFNLDDDVEQKKQLGLRKRRRRTQRSWSSQLRRSFPNGSISS